MIERSSTVPADRNSWTEEEKTVAEILLAVTSVVSLEERMSPELLARVPSLPHFIKQAWIIAREIGWCDEGES
jgi:hypothetical protein